MFADSLRRKLEIIRRIVWRNYLLDPSMEVVYRDLFVRDLSDLGLKDIYYPVGGAASHSLLYLLLRTIREFKVRTILELGAGQSTLLIDALNVKLQRGMDVTTVEHDAEWATHIQSLVSHRVLHAPLANVTVHGKAIDYYSGGFLPPGKRFDLVLIDGPPAHLADRRFARIGCLDFLPDILAEDFMLIIDDAERQGEAYLVARLAETFRSRQVAVRQASIAGMKMQAWFCGGAFSGAQYF